MALPSTLVWEVDVATGGDDHGGGFDPSVASAGTDYTQGAGQTTVAFTDLKTDGATTTVMVSAGRSFVAADVGNTVQVSGGTHATAGFYSIRSVSSGKATVDRAWATADNSDHADGVGVMGGALASPAVATGVAVEANAIYVKYRATPYDISVNSNNVSGGYLTANAGVRLVGYDSTRSLTNTDANRPTIRATTAVTSMLSAYDAFARRRVTRNVIIDGNSLATNGIYGSADQHVCVHVRITGCNTGVTGPLYMLWCELSYCTTYGSYSASILCGCRVHHCATGVRAEGGWLEQCIIDHCTGNGVYDAGFGNRFSHCVAYKNGGHGFMSMADQRLTAFLTNCISYGNSGTGLVCGVNYPVMGFAAGNNTSGNISAGNLFTEGMVTLTADPFVDGDNGDFALNTAAGGGAACRAAGFPSAFDGSATSVYADLGAVQHADPTVDYPDVGNVTEDDTVGGVQGTYHEATTAEVQSGVTFGASSSLTGTYTGGTGSGGGPLVGPSALISA